MAELKLDDEQLRIVEKFARTKSFKDGQILVAAGARDPNFYVIRSGEVETVEYSSGKPQTVWKGGPREFLGEVSFLAGIASNLSRVAKGNVEVFEIPSENLRRIIDEEPKLGNIILATLITRMQIMRDLNLTPLRVIGSRFSSDTFRIRDFFTRNRVFFTWIDIENNPDVDPLLKQLKITEEDTPVVICGNEWVLRNPANRELAARLGILTALKEKMYDLKTGSAVTNSPVWTANRQPFFLETSRPGVFAAGDVRSRSMKRVASAVGEGAMAVAFVHEYLRNS